MFSSANPGPGRRQLSGRRPTPTAGSTCRCATFFAYDDKPEWHGTTLYLDGLDEVRAGLVDGRPPLDRVRAKLDGLRRPRFRLSCRWADWLGANDRDSLGQVCSGTLTVLHLDPLSEQDIKRILAENHAISDPEEFIAEARERGVHGLLTNPQNLDLLAKVVSGGNWPGSRHETFETACEMLVTETQQRALPRQPHGR